MLIGDLEQRAPHRRRIDRAGRVVRIDDDERARRRRDQAREMIEVRHPAARRDRSGSTSARAPIFASTAV